MGTDPSEREKAEVRGNRDSPYRQRESGGTARTGRQSQCTATAWSDADATRRLTSSRTICRTPPHTPFHPSPPACGSEKAEGPRLGSSQCAWPLRHPESSIAWALSMEAETG